MAQVTTATKKLLKLKKKIRAVSGGTGASKTYSIVMILIDYAQTAKNERIDIVSESYPHLSAGVIQDFKEIMIGQGYWKDERWNDSKHLYTFETGSTIKFMSVDKLGKAHGPRRDILFLNECNYIPYLIADQLIARTRKIVWLDWNPSEDFWFYEEIFGKRKDIDFMGEGGDCPPLTFKDNEGLSQSERDEIEARKHNKNWWRVYGLGMRGELEERIFTNWKVIDEIPHEARLERRWLDFGFSNDFTAIGDLYYYDGGYILDEVTYQKGLKNKPIADILLAQEEPQTLAIADSAEPKSIAEIKDFGVNVSGVSKRSGDTKSVGFVKWSIGIVQQQKISVTRRSINILKEQRNYLWFRDKDGKITNIEDPSCENHHMRGIAYALCSIVPIQRGIEQRRQMGMMRHSLTTPRQQNPV